MSAAGLLCAAAGLRAGAGVLPAPPLVDPGRMAVWWRSLGPVVATFAAARLALLVFTVVWLVGIIVGLSVGVLVSTGRLPASCLRRLAGWSAGRRWGRLLLVALGLSASSGLLAACGGGGGGTRVSGGAATGRAVAPVLVGPVSVAPAGAGPAAVTPSGVGPAPVAPALMGPAEVSPAGAVAPPVRAGSAPAVAPPLRVAPPGRTAPPNEPSPSGTWTVRPGDDFWSIAEAVVARTRGADPASVGRYWSVLMAANKDRLPVPGDPGLLFPGDVLVVPPVGR